MARKGRGQPLRACPPEACFPPKGPEKTAFWFLCRRGQRNPPPGRWNSPFAGVCLSERSERHERIAGGRRNRTGGKTARSSMSAYPRTPITGDASRAAVPRIRRGRCSRLSPLPRRCRWPGGLGRAVRLDDGSAPGASSCRGWFRSGGRRNALLKSSRRGWFRNFGRMVSAPTEAAERRPKKPGREGNSRVQTAEMTNQHLTNISGGGAVGILGQNPNFLIHVERKHHRNAFFLVRHIIHLRDILREYPLKVNEQGGTTS